MKLLSVHFPQKLIEDLDLLVLYKIFPNRSEAIRSAVRDLIKTEILSRSHIRLEKGKEDD